MKTADDRVGSHAQLGVAFEMVVVGRFTPEVKHIAAVLSQHWGRSSTGRAYRHRSGRVSPGPRVWEKRRGFTGRFPASRQLQSRAYKARRLREPEIYLVNALTADRTTEPTHVAQLVRSIRNRSSDVPILVLLDETNPAALRAARDAGATGYLGAREAANDEAIHWRVWDAVRASQRATVPSPHARELLPAARVTPQAAPSAAEVAAAREAIEGAVDSFPTPAERLARAAEWIRVDAPALRDPKSGRLDAARIAAVLGVPVSRLAAVAGVTQQALSARPDSPKAQPGLQPLARVISALEELIPEAHRQMWLNAPLQRLRGETPLSMILDGRADVLARTLEWALEGGSE